MRMVEPFLEIRSVELGVRALALLVDEEAGWKRSSGKGALRSCGSSRAISAQSTSRRPASP